MDPRHWPCRSRSANRYSHWHWPLPPYRRRANYADYGNVSIIGVIQGQLLCKVCSLSSPKPRVRGGCDSLYYFQILHKKGVSCGADPSPQETSCLKNLARRDWLTDGPLNGFMPIYIESLRDQRYHDRTIRGYLGDRKDSLRNGQ